MKGAKEANVKFIKNFSLRRFRLREDGQSLVMFIFMFFLLITASVGAIDYGTYMRARQRLEISVDAAVLAGGLELPKNGATAISMAFQYININDPDVNLENVSPSFRCLVGDRNHDGSPDSEDIPAVCNPGPNASFSCNDGLCMSDCTFVDNNTCNVMALRASKEVPLIFTQLLGLSPVEITASRTGACKGPCGAPPKVPLDVIIILDRTGSMSPSDLAAAKEGALAILEIFNPEFQHVGLAVLGSGSPFNPCIEKLPDQGGNWLVVPLSDDYQNLDGSLNTSSQLVSTIDCLETGNMTNLGSPLYDYYYRRPDALSELMSSTRDVKQGVILMSDGAANRPTWTSCSYANSMANVVKDQDIEIFTIGYGIESERCVDWWGGYRSARVTKLLADMATDSSDDHGHCLTEEAIEAENTDGDNFLCKPRGGDLQEVFKAAAIALSTGIKLIPYPGD